LVFALQCVTVSLYLFFIFHLFSALRMGVASWRGGTTDLCPGWQNIRATTTFPLMKRSSGYNRTLVQLLYICAYCFAGSKRGPKFGRLLKCQLFLLGKCNDDFIPSSAEQARLTRNGMGRLTCVLALLCSFHRLITPLNNLSVFS